MEVWQEKMKEMDDMKNQLRVQQRETEKEIEQAAEVLGKLNSNTAIARLEARMASMEEAVQSISDRLGLIEAEMPEVRTAVRKVRGFMETPAQTWKTGSAHQREAVSKENGVGTAQLSTPFRVLQESKGDKETLVGEDLICTNPFTPEHSLYESIW
ncbi:MAG: hypothetical protein DI628_00460 [Blastochloris viridis]|uniref:Uncharacterized protein n=1 Tax=Blastochloris viridis TaxID=1079 RepID=A0A6N4RAR0_BLAVI|nr:MAG: hypothetical protein DI628_00460 [Blastochloris viridis]